MVRAASSTTSRGREVLAADDRLGQVGRGGHARPGHPGGRRIGRLVDLCRELLAANPKIVAEVKEGKPKGLGQLIGQAKKKNPNVNPNRVRENLLELIEGSKAP